jgi:hypothetical protein
LARNALLGTAGRIAERSYDLLVMSLSENSEITDQEWDILTEKKKATDRN